MEKVVEDFEDFRLHKAVAAESRKQCEELIAASEDVNSVDQLGWTPLMHAIHNRHPLLAKDLLSRGAKICVQNDHGVCHQHAASGVTVFTLAIAGCDEDLLSTLYQGLTPDLQQDESNIGLQVASLRGEYSVARWLITNTNVDINWVSPITGVTSLHLAVIGNHYKIAELLLMNGANVTITSALGQDAFSLAESGNTRLLQLLSQTATPTQELYFNFSEDLTKPTSDYTDSQYTSNNIYFDIQEDIVLKNSPCRPVFKTCEDDNKFDSSSDQHSMYLLSPSMKSVFLLSPQSANKPLNQSWSDNNQEHNVFALLSPRAFHPLKSPEESRGKKRKLLNSSGCSSGLKRLIKRRTRSVDDELENINSEEVFNFLKPSGVDFSHLLFTLGLEEFFPIFREHELDIWTFLTLTKEDLDGMGLTNLESQTLILNRIQMLKKTQI